MWSAEQIVQELQRRGELWQVAPGLVGMRGDVLRLFRALQARIAAISLDETGDEWLLPQGITLETLQRADYFAAFPHWLTAASHLGCDATALERIATASAPAEEARAQLEPSTAALPPALCYHTYPALARTQLSGTRIMTAQGTCWRHEAEQFAILERGWAFTMREVVCVGTDAVVEQFRQRGMRTAVALAEELGLEPSVESASDPFFAPTARGKALLQRVKGLKHELRLPIGSGRTVAAASFNHHELFFGEAFDIRQGDGRPAASGCVAYGLERWLLAVLVAHGPDAVGWPTIETQQEALR